MKLPPPESAKSGYERPVGALVAAFLTGPLGLAGFNECARRLGPGAGPGELPFCRRFLARAGRGARACAGLTVFPDGGQVDVRQPDPKSGMHIYFLGGPCIGHCHDDKNSFVLEAFGRLLLLDRGTPLYTHPAMPVATETAAHNALAPDGLSQTVAPSKVGAVLIRAEEWDGVVVIESDAAGCWPGLRPQSSTGRVLAGGVRRPTAGWSAWTGSNCA